MVLLRKLSGITLLVALPLCALGRDSDQARHDRIATVSGEVFAGSEIRENLRALCDGIGGRHSGTEAGRRARDFAERTFNRFGMTNVHQEEFELLAWERGPCACEVVSPMRILLHAVALGNSPSTPPEGLEAEVVDVGYGGAEEVARMRDRLRGNLALASSGVPPGGKWMHRTEIMARIVDAGAAALLYSANEPGNLPMAGICWNGRLAPAPAVGISKEDGDWIKRQIALGERVRVRLATSNLSGSAESANVVGEISGRGREFVVVGAHLDSWDLGQGAVDNGTGVVVVLEAARALAAIGARPEATIRFVLFMAEEMGLQGSNAYVEAHRGELAGCRAMINCDMEGTPRGIRVMGHEESHGFFAELIDCLPGFELTSGVSHRPGIYGDQQGFLLAGVPVVHPISPIEDGSARYYHTSADTYDKLTFGPLNLDAAFVAIIALELASTPERVMQPLGAEGVRALLHEYKLEDVLRSWEGDIGTDTR